MAVAVGLCATCAHAKVIMSSRGSTFTLCQLSFVDPRFAKYPALPVRACSGYQHEPTSADSPGPQRGP